MQKHTIVILPNIRSAYNVGSIFRTCDAIGIDKMYLVGYTPTPLDRFGRPQKEIAKTALGAEQSVEWEYVKDIHELLLKLKTENYKLIAIEQAENSQDYRAVELSQKNAFIFGPEVDGLPQDILDQCDVVAEIPMKGAKESLNVSVSAGVALFGMLQ